MAALAVSVSTESKSKKRKRDPSLPEPDLGQLNSDVPCTPSDVAAPARPRLVKLQVINVKKDQGPIGKKRPYAHVKDWLEQPGHIYTGRNVRVGFSRKRADNSGTGIFNLPHSPFANPFHVTSSVPREAAVAKYVEHMRKSGLVAKFRERLHEELQKHPELDMVQLGCWCRPVKPCHTEELVKAVCHEQEASTDAVDIVFQFVG